MHPSLLRDEATRDRMMSSNRQFVKPSALRPGDTVGIVAPASNIKRADLEAGCEALRRAGYRPFYFESILDQDLYFAGSVERRARELEEMCCASRAFSLQPLISIITPVFNTPVAWLEQTVVSVLAQVYENWELLLIDDASTESATVDLLSELERRDSRIRIIRREKNGGISVASNDGLAQARGEWVAILDHDDLLEPDALFQTAKEIDRLDRC